MTPGAALAEAHAAEPLPAGDVGSEWSIGTPLSVTPTDWGFDTVTGTCLAANRERVVIRRHDLEVGGVAVHFPRIGFAVTEA
jgi:hypothetical protein